jgi:predicted HTH transcriptional regulator
VGVLLDETRPLMFENLPALGATIQDIDEAHLWSFLREFEGDAFENARTSGYPTGEVLERDLLLATQLNGEPMPTVAGLLLFGHDARVVDLLPRSVIVATRFGGETTQSPIIERLIMSGNLLTLYESMLRFIRRYCDLWDSRPKAFSPAAEESPIAARANYNRGAVVEAVSNLLVHRDLALRELSTRLHIFDHSLELVNPRRTAGFSPLAQRAIRYGIPQRLNPQVAAIFSSRAYGLELKPGGLPTLLRDCRLFSNRRAEMIAINDEFRLRIHGV